ncbi:hypothetical protein, partial [Thiolapillus sp.]|uniref:hypothetical protein n=1 Tax=Thiolapillus sp. TaxID=2017437 RepID=UPI003AF70476
APQVTTDKLHIIKVVQFICSVNKKEHSWEEYPGDREPKTDNRTPGGERTLSDLPHQVIAKGGA